MVLPPLMSIFHKQYDQILVDINQTQMWHVSWVILSKGPSDYSMYGIGISTGVLP